MQSHPMNISSWTTSSFGDNADTSSAELASLRHHLSSCKGLHGKFFAVRCAAEAIDAHIKSRFVTTLVLATAFIAISSLAM
jgi:hypothetical protein